MDRISRLPLNSLRVLDALSRHESMSSAAEELGVEASAVSMQIRSLSDYLGIALTQKHGRGVALTPAALALLRPIAPALRQIAAALEQVREEPLGRPFRLSVLPSVLLRWLVPLVPRLEEVCAQRRLIITPDKSSTGAGKGGIDAAMRLGDGRWPDAVATKLMNEWVLPVCSPTQRSRLGWLAIGELPTNSYMLHSRLDSWRLWSPDAPKQARPLLFDDATAVVLAAERGMGVALTRWVLVADALKQGLLVQVGPAIPYRYSYYWVRPECCPDDPLNRALFQVLQEVAQEAATNIQFAVAPPH